MPQNKEATAFLERIKALPQGLGISLDDVLQLSLEDETELRRYFASDRAHARLLDPYVGLVDLFDAPADIRITRARVVKDDDEGADLVAKHIIPVPKEARRPEGAPSIVDDLDEFKKNWSIFTEGSLSQLLDWNNVVAAGGAVLACLTPLKEENKVSKRAIRKYYHSVAYPTSDVDLFLWGLTPEQAEAKINSIYEAVRDSVPWDVTCIRTRHTVSIHSQYPYRSIQIVLRLYQSPAEILAGFDIDAPCCAYDGVHVWANPRAIIAMMRQSNTVDMTRRSPSYEVRLAKYANRGFEVYVPDLVRDKVDPTIYERSIAKMEGLARLLVFEKLTDGDARYAFLESRRILRGRPNPLARYRRDKRRYKGDLKEEKAIGGLEMNDYDVASLHIPYGPGWDARRIDKLVYQTDLGMNSTFNPKNKGRRLHRHPAFFGTMQECLEDCCEACPEPIDDDERALIAKEDEYIIGRIKFIEENPGRQTMTGSFNPIDVGEWSEQVYVRETEKFFGAVARNDIEAVKEFIKAEIDLNHRDHVGRTCLHVAIICNATDVASELIEAGARISARLVDGRSALHLAARFDQTSVIEKLLHRSDANAEKVIKAEDEDAMDEDKTTALERPSSEDDWSSEDSEGKDVEMKDADDDSDEDADGSGHESDDGSGDGSDDGSDKPAKSNVDEPPASTIGDLPEDNEDEPDVLDINEPDWDFGFTPLSYAILYASLSTVNRLLTAGADVNKATSTNHNDAKQLHPLDITVLREDEEEACAIAERLIVAGASSSTADAQMNTIFHDIVASGKLNLAATILKRDPNAMTVIDFPSIRYSHLIFPIVTAVQKLDYAMVALLIAHGVKLDLAEEDITRAVEASNPKNRANLFGYGVKNYMDQAFTPLETAIVNNDDIVQLLLSFGAAYNLPLKYSKRYYTRPDDRRTLKDWVDRAIGIMEEKIEAAETVVVDPRSSELEAESEVILTGWKEYARDLKKALETETKSVKEKDEEQLKKHNQARELLKLNNIKSYLLDVQRLLDARSAKSWTELYPDVETVLTKNAGPTQRKRKQNETTEDINSDYAFLTTSYSSLYVPITISKAYDELYEACFLGDNEKIKTLCLPPPALTESSGPRSVPLNINVEVGDPKNYHYRSGWTPLFVACANRHWETAKLIVAIAAAQYSPGDDEDKRVTFTTSGFKLDEDDSDEDSDGGSEDSDDSDDTVEQKKEAEFVDIAKISSTVKSELHPSYIISKATFQFRCGDKVQSGNLLTQAAMLKDLESFVNIANLYQCLSDPIDIDAELTEIVRVDNPEILDEYIRRSGYGLDFEAAKKATEHLPSVVNDENRVYLGLNVHGKKRADLARKNDPNASREGSYTVPLVWQAAEAGAVKVIEYLSTNKPLAAFRAHAQGFSDARAEQLRRTPDLEKVLPLWLGWTINNLGESPLTAAIMGRSLPAIKMLFAKMPQLMKTSLHQTIKFTGHNAFLLAVERQSKPELLDYLLAKSVSPAVHDTNKGWNIFHHVCYQNDVELLAYLLKKLPKDVCQALLKQQSKGRLTTPLHAGVASGAIEVVGMVLNFDVSTALATNIDGQTPLHFAVARGFSNITKQLLATPQQGGLFMEDSIGQTPYESSSLKEMLNRLGNSNRVTPNTLSPESVDTNAPDRIAIEHLEKGIPRLREVTKVMIDEGKPKDPSKYAFDMNVFVKTLESSVEQAKQKLGALPAKPEPQADQTKNPLDHQDIASTQKYLQEVLSSIPTPQRTLVRLLDVQQSVSANLKRVAADRSASNDHDSDAEEDPVKKEWNQTMVQTCINTNVDDL